MSVQRRKIVKYLEDNGYALDREGGKHSIYKKGTRTVTLKRHRMIHRIIANKICKQADLPPAF